MNKKENLPHTELFERLYLALMPIQRQLLIVQSLLKWTLAVLSNREKNYVGCTLFLKHIETKEKQIGAIALLKGFENEVGFEIKQLMRHLRDFAPFPSIEEALVDLASSYQSLPFIEPDLQLLALSGDLLENKDLIPNLVLYTEKLKEIQTKGFVLKEKIFSEMLNNLSYSFEEPSLRERIDKSS